MKRSHAAFGRSLLEESRHDPDPRDVDDRVEQREEHEGGQHLTSGHGARDGIDRPQAHVR